ncbi:MAG TPA: hypothetical protein VKB34_09250 [Povalibacter sp.]|nr:hypothetical protein [Povalibacter sp.]
MIPVSTPAGDDFRWVLRYSAPAFSVLVLWHCWIVGRTLPQFREMFAAFGSELQPDTQFVLTYYWIGALAVAALSVLSTGFLVSRPQAPVRQLKLAYLVSICALVGAFMWSGFTMKAVFGTIAVLGKAI